MAMYYDLGTIQSGKEGIVNTYYGVFSNEKTDLETDQVTFNMTSPSVLDLSTDGKIMFLPATAIQTEPLKRTASLIFRQL